MTHMPKGYAVISRCLRNHPVVGVKSGHMAHWIDILLATAGVDGYQGLRRGEVRLSLRTLAEDWGVSVKVVRNLLAKLQEQNMLQKGAHPSPKKGTHRNTVGNTVKERDLTVSVPPSPQIDLEDAIQARDKSDAQKAVDLWNDLAKREGLPQVKVLTDARRKSINARIKEAGGLDGFRQVVDYIGKTPVLIGKEKFSDGRTWKADFEYLVQPSSFVRNLEKAQAQKPAEPKRRKSFDEIDWTE